MHNITKKYGNHSKTKKYARLVVSGMELHTAALEAGCKNHKAARKFVANMAHRKNVQAISQYPLIY
ncbi:hypothetical protein LU293_09420 [Moraxella nasovis]|uniref:hypothetical protein n=1 Tax=Moraxella nasovis TaxID=2904121 RepID=UPI001F6139E9|nr:hypothetical protein [Moraxella nasovis]UNU73268.1 hypothetical protein LU293_09420 [Moraxella nasovis]